jgi:glucose-6-phosphate isomerase
MDFQQLWQRYEEWLYYHDGLGLYLDISRISSDDALVETLKTQFAKAFQDMAVLDGGAIANPDENRRVGHYWLGNPELAPSELQKEIVETLVAIADFTQKVHEGTIYPPEVSKFTDILSIGIGGSALAPEFVLEGQGKPLTHKVRYLPSRFNFTVLFFS